METPQTAASIAAMFKAADAREFAVLERSFAADTRRTVQNAINAARKRLEAEALEEQRVREMTARANELDGWIASIDDTIVRRAMTLRYLQGLTWPQVAARMGYASESGARMAVRRYIEKLPVE